MGGWNGQAEATCSIPVDTTLFEIELSGQANPVIAHTSSPVTQKLAAVANAAP